jgi:hypothetical protein
MLKRRTVMLGGLAAPALLGGGRGAFGQAGGPIRIATAGPMTGQ